MNNIIIWIHNKTTPNFKIIKCAYNDNYIY